MHITKDDFFAAYIEAFNASITKRNIKAGFRATRLVLLDPKSIINHLDLKFIMPSLLVSRPRTTYSWVTKTPYIAIKVGQQSTVIKNKIARH
jgi:hypothetical protein